MPTLIAPHDPPSNARPRPASASFPAQASTPSKPCKIEDLPGRRLATPPPLSAGGILAGKNLTVERFDLALHGLDLKARTQPVAPCGGAGGDLRRMGEQALDRLGERTGI